MANARPNPAAAERRALRSALNAQAALIEEMNAERGKINAAFKTLAKRLNETKIELEHAKRSLAVQAVRNETSSRQIVALAEHTSMIDPIVAIGKAGHAKAAALVTANGANPAQPIPEPKPEAPVVTEMEAMQPAGRDDVTQIGATPVSDVSADATVAVDEPYGVYAESPVGLNRVDVTAPVEGTDVQRPAQETIIPVDVRIGNPDNPQGAFPWTMGPVGPGAPVPPGASVGNPVTAQKRAYATLHLAKLQLQANIARGDEIEVAAALDASGISDSDIATQISTLAAVLKNRGVSEVPKKLVPKAASANPVSFTSRGGSVSDDEIGFF